MPGCRRTILLAVFLAGLASSTRSGRADDPPARPRPFRIQVVDASTGRGVPLVELRTVNQIRYVTDSNGLVAFDEPGLLDTAVFFTITSHGYEADRDNFGYRGARLQVRAGGSAQIKIRRTNIAERLYRVTGEGIYRDSVLTGDSVLIKAPLLNGRVLGQDSVVNAVYRGKIYWFWGDTNRPDYPLGNFHVPGATSELPERGGLDPSRGVDLAYFLDEKGFARPTAPLPGEGPTWISGLVVLRDRDGGERMFANYAKIRNMLDVYQRGLVEFRPQTGRFEKVVEFPEAPGQTVDFPSGHPFFHEDGGVEYVYYAAPYPLLRVAADPARLGDPEAYEAYTPLRPGTGRSRPEFDRGADGELRYGWKRNTQVLPQDVQDRLIASGQIHAREALLNLRDIESGKRVLAHGGSVYWNPHRNRWVMIAVESFGASSFLGEVWFAEADTPLGPWTYARKIVTHDKYSFYNPKQHPMLDQQGGRILYFEGTYTSTFSGNSDMTPRYDYNQVMYRLDLDDPRLALPVPVYSTLGGGTTRLFVTGSQPEGADRTAHLVAFFAPDRPGIANVPVYNERDSSGGFILRVGKPPAPAAGNATTPLFYIRPDDSKVPMGATVRLYEYIDESGGRRSYSVEAPGGPGRTTPKAHPLGRVWPNPAGTLRW
ncbi:MAG: hypothetical protein ACYC61_00465 [Isosphaeraceae bacterium]